MRVFVLLSLALAVLLSGCGGGGGGSNTPSGETFVITPAAGTYRMNSRPVTLDVPVGSVPANTSVTLSAENITSVPQAFPIAGTGFYSTSATFSNPITVRINFTGLNVPAAEETALAIFKETNGSWQELTTSIDSASKVASAQTTSLTRFVLARKVLRAKWTVLVFMNAANDLSQFSALNMNQMEQIADNPDVRFVVQWKQVPSLGFPTQFDGTRRYVAQHDDTDQIKSRLIQDMGAGVDMGLVSTLRQFVNWGKQEFPADRYVLVVWNHGNGWQRKPGQDEQTRGVSYDDQTGNLIQTWQLQEALQGLGMDILAFDASLMQMVEVAYEMRNHVPYIAGSEESPPGEGYPYHLVFKGFRDNPNSSTAALSKGFVDGMLNFPNYANRKITQSVLDSSKLDSVSVAVSTLGTTLLAHPELSTQIKAARDTAQGYSVRFFRVYVDLVGFCQELSMRVSIADVKAACAGVIQAVQSATVWEGHNAQSPKSHGLSIDLSSGEQFANLRENYEKLQWATNTTWDEWLATAP